MKRIFFILIWGTILGTGCNRSEKEIALLNALSKDEPVQEAFNVTFIFSEKGAVQARLKAPHVAMRKRDQQEVSIFDKGLQLIFYNEEGKEQSNLTGNYGEFTKEFGEALVKGNVLVINEVGDRLETEKLMWSTAEDSIFTDEFVKIQTQKEIIFGDSMKAATDFSGYKIFHIRGTMQLEEGTL